MMGDNDQILVTRSNVTPYGPSDNNEQGNSKSREIPNKQQRLQSSDYKKTLATLLLCV